MKLFVRGLFCVLLAGFFSNRLCFGPEASFERR